MINQIIQGDTLAVLKTMPDEYVNTIITSPPYWGLRDYGEETYLVWGGAVDCKHSFLIKHRRQNDKSGGHGQGCKLGAAAAQDNARFGPPSTTCSKCGAWYGQLGLEPTLDLYIEHLLQITAELKRVLKKTGVMFWNHGDCYGNSAGRNDRTGSRKGFGQKGQIDLKIPVQDKCLVMQNYRLILRMIDDQGWILRNTIVWHKPNAMPSSVKDRFANSYEPVFMLVKNKKYWFDLDAVRVPVTTFENRPMGIDREKDYPNAKRNKNAFNYRVRDAEKKSGACPQFKASEEEVERYKKQKFITPEQQKETQEKTGWREGSGRIRSFFDNYGGETNPAGKNPGDVWKIPTQPFPAAHFATFPQRLVEPMIKAGTPKGGIVLDPFCGSGTTLYVARELSRRYIGIELSAEYIKIANKRLSQGVLF